MQERNAMAAERADMLQGILGAGPSLFNSMNTGTGPPKGTGTSGQVTDRNRLPRNGEAAALEATQPPQKEARP